MARNVQKDTASKTTIWPTLIFVIAWPILLAILTHYHFLDGIITHLDITSSNIIMTSIILLPPAIVLLPLTYQLDFYSIKLSKVPTWQRIVVSVLATGALLWLLWCVFVFVSLAL